eukprot:1035140-Pelagomonas_calceolata.AAC.5
MIAALQVCRTSHPSKRMPAGLKRTGKLQSDIHDTAALQVCRTSHPSKRMPAGQEHTGKF